MSDVHGSDVHGSDVHGSDVHGSDLEGSEVGDSVGAAGDEAEAWAPPNEPLAELTPVEARILGCLVEKENTTPDVYPLTTKSLVSACNQKSNRDPVVAYSEIEVDQALLHLREVGLVRVVKQSGARSMKHRHVLDEAWGLPKGHLAIVAVLLLRGPQTPGELRTRTERLAAFESLDEIEAALGALASRNRTVVQRLERQPGQKESRWAHLLGDPASAALPQPTALPTAQPTALPEPTELPERTALPEPTELSPQRPATAQPLVEVDTANRVGAPQSAEIDLLRSELAELRRRFDLLCERLGEDLKEV